jgi:hypothetical protein
MCNSCKIRVANKSAKILKIQSTKKTSGQLLIGKDIPWKTIEQEGLRIKHFATFAEVQGTKVKHSSATMPYGLLTVESTKLPQEATLPVAHKVDFRNLWEAFKIRGVNPEEEAIVFYAPQSGFLSTFKPKLHIFIYPKGHLEEMHDPSFKPDNPIAWFEPIEEWNQNGSSYKKRDKNLVELKYLAKYRDIAGSKACDEFVKEYVATEVVFQPIRDNFNTDEQDELFKQIDESGSLSPRERFEAIAGLIMLMDGQFPELKRIESLGTVFGNKFVETVVLTRQRIKSDAATEKLIRLVEAKFGKKS